MFTIISNCVLGTCYEKPVTKKVKCKQCLLLYDISSVVVIVYITKNYIDCSEIDPMEPKHQNKSLF